LNKYIIPIIILRATMGSGNLISILLADNSILDRERFKRLLYEVKNIECIGEASNGTEAIELSRKLQPDIMLMDTLLSRPNFWETARIIRWNSIRTKILFLLWASDDEKLLQAAVQLNYEGIITKSISRSEFLNAINIVANGGKYFDAMILENVMNLNNGNLNKAGEQALISKREKAILELIALNMSNCEIADKLFISSRTVEVHKRNLIEKLSLKNSRELHAYAINETTLNRYKKE
jgi:DNA-binding NarL/FixJ family response regulator